MPEKMPETYRPSGQKYSRHGRVFQLKLLMLFMSRGCKKSYTFSLATEIEAAKAFDDVLFKYKDENGDVIYRFVQAKHILDEDGAGITHSDLLGETKEQRKGNFHLLKYFQSFLEIKENGKPDGIFDNLKLRDLVIYTNRGIDFQDMKRNKITLGKLDETDDILGNEPTEEKIPEMYRFVDFPENEKEMFYSSSDIIHQMAKDLAKNVCHDRPIDLNKENFCKFHKALVKENIIDPATRKLHENFVQNEGLSENGKEFYRTFLLEGMKQSKATREEFLNEMKSKKLNLCKEFGQSKHELVEKLPTDRVNNGIIEEYLKYLTLAVNQPTSEQLDEIIKNEMREQFNINDSGLITDKFYYYLWEWMADRHGRFLTDLDVRQFYETAQKRLEKLSIIGVRSNNQEKNLKCGDFFKDIREMERHLTCTEPVINIVAPRSTTLAFMRVVQALKKFPTDSFAAVEASFLVSNEEKYLTVFDIEEPFTMVVEWSAIRNNEHEVNKLVENILSKIKPKYNQKLVLISQSAKLNCGNETLSFKHETTTKTKFCDLTAEAQSRILSTEVTLQDRKCILSELVSGNADCITEEMIDLIINKENLVISENVDLGDIKDYYMERCFKKYVKYTVEDLTKEFGKDTLVILNEKQTELLELMPNEKVCNFGDEDYINRLSRIIVVQDLEQYKEILQNYKPHKNIHLFNKINNCFVWVAKDGMQTNYSEDELLLMKDDVQLIIIAAEQQLKGKSTVFKHLALSLMNKNCNYWVLLIDLRNFVDVLKDGEFSSPESIINFIIDSQELKNQFEKDLLRAYILDVGKIVIFFHGFDECQPYKSKIISMLRYLETTKTERVYIATQVQFVEKLETEFRANQYRMCAFSSKDYVVLLKKIWKQNLKLRDENSVEERLDLFANSLVTSFTESANLLTSIFLKIPSHAQMIANVYQEQLEKHLKCDNPKLHLDLEIITGPTMEQPIIPVGRLRCNTGFDLLELYRAFVKNRMEIALREKMQLKEKTVKYIFEEIISPRILQMHENLAVCQQLPEEFRNAFKADKELPNIAMEDVALVQKHNDEYYFIHPTFTQYFIAQRIDKLLSEYDSGTERYKRLIEILTLNLFDKSNAITRQFLDSMLAHQSEIHFAVLNRDIKSLKEIISKDPMEIQKRDALDRTPMHYACMNNAVDIVHYIIEKDVSCVSDLDAFQFAPISYASLNRSPQILEMLFQVGANDDRFENSLKALANRYKSECTFIYGNLYIPEVEQLTFDILEFANVKQRALLVNHLDYKLFVLEVLRKTDYKGAPSFFFLASGAQKKEMLIQNHYEIIRVFFIKRNPVEIWTILKNCIDEEMKDVISQLEEYKTKFRSLLNSDPSYQLRFLIKLANPKQLENLWGKNGYGRYFIKCANLRQCFLVYELMQLFKGENLFHYLGPKFVNYFEDLFSNKQTYWAGKLFEYTNAGQRKQLLKPELWFKELNNALETNDYNSFNFLLNCVMNKSKREKMLKYVRHMKVFRTAVLENDLKKLTVLSYCNDDECQVLTESLQEEDYYRLFANNLDNIQSLFSFAHYATRKEREEVFSLAECPNYVLETVEDHSRLGIESANKHNEKLLEALRPNAIVEEICEKKWSIWGRLIYVLCKHIKTTPPVEISLRLNINFRS